MPSRRQRFMSPWERRRLDEEWAKRDRAAADRMGALTGIDEDVKAQSEPARELTADEAAEALSAAFRARLRQAKEPERIEIDESEIPY